MKLSNLWEKVEQKIEQLEHKFFEIENKEYNPDKGYDQARTRGGLYYHGQIVALATLMQDEVYETKSVHREIN